MNELPPSTRDQRQIDNSHLSLLAIFHYVLAALSLVGLGFLFLHWFILHSVFQNPEVWKEQKNGPAPKQLFAIFQWFYLFGGFMIVSAGICNLLSAIFIQQRRARMFSLIVAGLDCLCFPFGTALGVFTLIVLV